MKNSILFSLIFFLLNIWIAFPVVAQQQEDTLTYSLPPIDIQAARSVVTDATAPFSLNRLERTETARAIEPGISLDEVLASVPGIWVNHRSHDATGERIVIRGMGWQSAFGVRGVQVLLDGIPLTMPDGQAVADIIDPAMISRAETIRGPSSLFWGNGSGGVIYMSTDTPEDLPFLKIRGLAGSHGHQNWRLHAKVNASSNPIQLFISDNQIDGYRDYSAGRFTRGTLHSRINLGSRSQLRLTGAFALQDAENPGQLTTGQIEENRRQANGRNFSTLAGKESLQIQAGAVLIHETEIGQLSLAGFGLSRDLDNPLSFAYIDLNRNAGGLRAALQNENEDIKWGVGADLGMQDDSRLNFNNEAGQPGDERSLDQQESVRNIAGYGYLAYNITDQLQAMIGIRADQVHFEMDDRLLNNGDQSGDRTFAALSPAVSFSFDAGTILYHANVRTGFETPTTTELVNRPDLTGGFNPDISPQRTSGIEVGARGAIINANIYFDVALYRMNVTSLLLPFQTEAGGDRTFYRNGGRNTHAGLEFLVSWMPTEWISFNTTFWKAKYDFRVDEILAGNEIPGVPDQRIYGESRVSLDNFWLKLSIEAVSDYFVDSANENTNAAYSIFDLRIGHPGIQAGRVHLQPFAGIGNLFDKAYNGSVVINAFGGRYYEPAPGRTFQAGLSATFK